MSASMPVNFGDAAPARRVRICYLNAWADTFEGAAAYLARMPGMDIRSRIADSKDDSLLRKARLDCDWYGENLRCFAAMESPGVEFLSAWVVSPAAILDVAKAPREPREERWLVSMAHQPQSLGNVAGKAFALLARTGVRHLFYAFDEASRFMPCFAEIAPSLDVLIHDESPLDPATSRGLRPDCLKVHRSWVANFVPFSTPFVDAPEDRILFLGSQLGLTPHRQRQIEHLRRHFKDRFVAISDHSVSVAERASLGRYKVGLCPEGRKFATPAMSATHTDRPFWCGCLGLIPVSENSRAGGRLDKLAQAGLIERYAHGDLRDLVEACERALATPIEKRRRIYDHFNQHETVGAVVAETLEAFRRLKSEE